MDGGEQSSGKLVVASGQPAKLFELVEEAFVAIAPAIEFLIGRRLDATGTQRLLQRWHERGYLAV